MSLCIEYMYSHIAEAAVHSQVITWYQYTLSLAHYQLSLVMQINITNTFLLHHKINNSVLLQDKRSRDNEVWNDKPSATFKPITNQWELLRRVIYFLT